MHRIVLGLIVAALLAGCSADDAPEPTATETGTQTPSSSSSTSTSATQSTSTTTTTSPPPKRDPVTWGLDIQDNSFPGGSIKVQVNDSVKWTHRGNNPHSVTGDAGTPSDFDSGSGNPVVWMRGGDTFTYVFDEVGEYPYHCDVHASMTGKITVLDRHDATPP